MADQTRETKYADASSFEGAKFAATDKMRLYKSTFAPNQSSTQADFAANEVNFTGYAAVTLAGGHAVGLDISGNVELISLDLAQFQQTAVTLTDIAGGWWIEDTGGTVVKLFNPLDAPFAFDRAGNTLLIKSNETITEDSGADVESVIGP